MQGRDRIRALVKPSNTSMLELPLIVLIVVLFVKLSNLRKRVADLELGAGKVQVATPSVSTPVMSAPIATPTVAPPAIPTGPNSFEKFLKWCTEDWLLKLGGLLLLIGFGWFASYAFLHNWIGPLGRITLGIIAGTLILVLGWWRIGKYLHQGGIFLVLGSTTILLTIYAAREIYDFFTPTSALIVMFLSTLVVTVAAVRYKSRQLAILAIILAGIAPLLTNSPVADYVSLFTYLLVVCVAAIWVVAVTGWRELVLESLLVVTLYSISQYFSFSNDKEILLLLAYVFTALFFVTSILGIHKSRNVIAIDGINAIGVGLFLLAWVITTGKEEWQSLILAAWAIVFMTGAFMLYRRIGRIEPLYIHAGIGLGLIAAATAVELDGPALTTAYIIETSLAIVLSYVLTRDWRTVSRTSFLLLGPMTLSIKSITSYSWYEKILQGDFFVLLLMGLTLLTMGYIFWKNKDTSKQSETLIAVILSLGSIYLYALIWLSLHSAFDYADRSVIISLLIYTIIGLTCYFMGKARSINMLRRYGALVLGAVVVRLLLVDVWQMELTGKIITFFAVGALLVSTAFIGRGKKVATIAIFIFAIVVPSVRTVDATTPAEIQSAFRLYAPIEINQLTVPTLVEISYDTPTIERAEVAVFDETKGSLIPGQSVFGYPNTLSFSASSEEALMTDNLYNTCSTFWLPEGDGQGVVTLQFETETVISASGLVLSLDAGTILPKTVSIFAVVDGTHRTLVAKREIKSTIILFPAVSARNWQFDFSFNQPLRICEINLVTENRPQDYYMARFLAQPGHSYSLYYDADRYPGYADLGDVPNFFPQDTRNNPVLFASLGMPQNNPVYVIADVDKDGVPDIGDNCGKVVNPNQEDLDNDGIGDNCEDFDQDGLLGGFDNCPNDPNRYQEDTDGDEVGDVCDSEESRLTEKYPWLPWTGIGIAAVVLISMLVLSMRSPK